MHDFAPIGDLPSVTAMSRRSQLRALAIAGAGLLGVLLLVLIVHWIAALGPVPEPRDPPGSFRPTAEQRAALTMQVVGRGDLDSRTSATGTISADGDHSTPVLLPFAGQVVRVLVDAGQHVVRGQPLLLVRTGDFVDARNTLFTARSTLLAARAQLASAQRNAERQRQIYESAGGALKDYQQAGADLVAAQSVARTAEAALGAARDKLAILGKSPAEIARLENAGEVAGIHAETTLHAPIGGLVAERDVAAGQYVGAGGDKPVMTITDPARVWLIAQVAESDAAAVHVGDAVDVTTPAFPGRVFRAVINTVGAALDPATHRLPVRAAIANPDGALKPQMFASFAITRPGQGAVIHVPAAAVIHEGDTARVWVLSASGLLVAREVRVGEEDGGQVRILSGLAVGERIVTAGALFVNEAGLGE
jgi:cobalt-zinc-cadmium efflux system membrane fusion protein